MNVSDWVWADGHCPVICAFYQSSVFNFPCSYFWKRGHRVGVVWVLPGLLLLSWLRTGMDMKWLHHPSVVFQMWKSLSLVSVALKGLDCLQRQQESKIGNDLLVLSFSTEFCCFYSKQSPSFPCVPESRLLDHPIVLWWFFLLLRNSSFELRQPCSNCNA